MSAPRPAESRNGTPERSMSRRPPPPSSVSDSRNWPTVKASSSPTGRQMVYSPTWSTLISSTQPPGGTEQDNLLNRPGDRTRGRAPTTPAVRCGPVADILIASDADWVVDELRASIEGPDTPVRAVRRGEDVPAAIRQQTP